MMIGFDWLVTVVTVVAVFPIKPYTHETIRKDTRDMFNRKVYDHRDHRGHWPI